MSNGIFILILENKIIFIYFYAFSGLWNGSLLYILCVSVTLQEDAVHNF